VGVRQLDSLRLACVNRGALVSVQTRASGQPAQAIDQFDLQCGGGRDA